MENIVKRGTGIIGLIVAAMILYLNSQGTISESDVTVYFAVMIVAVMATLYIESKLK